MKPVHFLYSFSFMVADSIDLVELLMTIEEKKGIVVSDEDAVKLKTVKDVADYIEQHS